jgi:restriction system protein
MPEATSWWEHSIVQFFMRRGPMTATVVPLVAGLVFLYGTTMVVAIIAEHRLWTTSLEVTWVLVAGVGALVLTYLISLLATGAVFTRSRYNRLLTLHQSMRDIRNMSWIEFEELVAANYAAQGYEVARVGQAGPDGGIDLRMKKKGETVLVQCKHYRNSWVHELPLRQFLGLLESYKADRGIFVSCGVFDEAAEKFAKKNPRIELVAGERLAQMIQEAVRQKLAGRTYPCPLCGAPTNPKTGRRGPFLSCSNYPACKGALDWPNDSGRVVRDGSFGR